MIGIDLGTTNSLVAIMKDGEPEVLANELEDVLTPSAVAVAEDGELLVGRAARDRLIVDSDSGISQFKRDMGMDTRYSFGGREWTPTECSAVVLKEMKRIAEMHLGREVKSAVITVPAYFHDQQRLATVEAAEIAGIEVKRLVNEPTAAALAYGYRQSDAEENLFIFDLGGGTFDVTLLEVFEGVIEVKASGGVSRLGGEDYTDALAKWAITQVGEEPDDEVRMRWRQQVEMAKRRLTKQEEVAVSVKGKELVIRREDFQEAAKELTARIRPVIKRCLRDVNFETSDIDDVLLVGGASRMPLVVKLVAEELGRVPNQTLDPDRVVALGAAVQSALVEGDEAVGDIVLTDVAPHTLGIETTHQLSETHREPGYYAPIIDRNTVVPVSRAKGFSTLHPQQDTVTVKVYQGEARKVSDNQKIGEFTVKGLKHQPAQRFPGDFEVRFSYDMNGLLEVEVTVLESGEKIAEVFEQRAGKLSKKEIEDAMKRLAPLKIHPRDKLPNRARLERANRLYEELVGHARERLSVLVEDFERALESEEEKEINIAASILDNFVDPFFKEEEGR